jgi:hypothetical protein
MAFDVKFEIGGISEDEQTAEGRERSASPGLLAVAHGFERDNVVHRDMTKVSIFVEDHNFCLWRADQRVIWVVNPMRITIRGFHQERAKGLRV